MTPGARTEYKRWVRSRYPLVCALLGAVLAWVPSLVHGPPPEKVNVLYLRGALAYALTGAHHL